MLLTMFLLGARLRGLRRACCSPPAPAASRSSSVRRRRCSPSSSSPPTSSRCARWAPRRSRPQEAPELHAMIERLCIQADLPKPQIAVADTPMPNAFAMGRSQKHATVCATTGIMELLSPGRARGRHGPRAHPHRQPRRDDHDARELLRLDRLDDRAVRLLLRRRLGSDDDDGPGLHRRASSSRWSSTSISFFLMQALSRYREFAADRGAAVITGRPSALASALLKISGDDGAHPAAGPARRTPR